MSKTEIVGMHTDSVSIEKLDVGDWFIFCRGLYRVVCIYGTSVTACKVGASENENSSISRGIHVLPVDVRIEYTPRACK